ncbi:hypothetical protein [Ferrimonas pelagia]|uniref:RelA/SpoT domain-containing protein n=1 Tax=Ferrimonas pelagia TaxID=1177826 RepID=A0ABP9EBS1_9GAMM
MSSMVPASRFSPVHRYQQEVDSLYQIKPVGGRSILQPDLPFERIYAKAPAAQDELNQLVVQAALLSGSTTVLPEIKARDRAELKIATELDGQFRLLTDLARATLVADDIEGVLSAYQALASQVEVISLENRFLNPKENGYRDLKVLVRLRQSGLVAEVQLHLSAIEAVKNGEEHKAYQQRQAIERRADVEKRPMTEWERAKVNRLQRYSRALFEEAWQRHLLPSFMAMV